jgi:hypothetical protein
MESRRSLTWKHMTCFEGNKMDADMEQSVDHVVSQLDFDKKDPAS